MERAIRSGLVLGFVSLLVAAPAVSAKEIAGVKFPDELQIEGKTLALNGAGFREGGVNRTKAFAVGLYLENKSKNHLKILRSKEIKHVVLKFVANVSKDSLIELLNAGFKSHGGDQLSAMKDRLKNLAGWLPSSGQGDTVEFSIVPGKGMIVLIKGEPKGQIEGDDFSRIFLAIWLADPPLEHKLRNNLLGRE